ncbi:hypothetical protein O0544_22255 [Edwardsiella anguillarum]|nr:hypothetical protein [Edwardsiella anguillarum]
MRKTAANLNTASGFHIAMILPGIAVTPVLLSSSSLGINSPAATSSPWYCWAG